LSLCGNKGGEKLAFCRNLERSKVPTDKYDKKHQQVEGLTTKRRKKTRRVTNTC